MADSKDYISCPDELGVIHVSEDVLAVAAAAAVLEVEGVGALAANLGSSLAEMQARKKNLSKGVRVTMAEEAVNVEVAILVKYGSSVQNVAKAVQSAVCTAIENTSGFAVANVNVHVAGVAFEHTKKAAQG